MADRATDDTISKQYVNIIHQQQLQNGETNEDKTLQLVSALGGIDNILSEYLSNSSINIQSNTLVEINQIIATPTQFLLQNRVHTNSYISKSVNININTEIHDIINKGTYYFYSDDNYLQSIFSKQMSA
eukprot:92243_1